MHSLISLTPKQLRRAANIQERIQSLNKDLAALLGMSTMAPNGTAGAKTKRRMSAAGRARIAAAARVRWARIKGTNGTSGKPKRKMRPATRAKIAAAARARWKKAKAAGRTTL
jgi:hypothetical protein